MRKIKTGTGLTRAMQSDNALSEKNWNQEVVHEALRPLNTPEKLDDAITALLIMAGAQARFVLNRWVLTNSKGKRTAVHETGTFADWHAALNSMLPGRFEQ